MATGPEHYQMAERALDKATSGFYSEDQQISWALAEAQVHATLALAAATALNDNSPGMAMPELNDWVGVASKYSGSRL